MRRSPFLIAMSLGLLLAGCASVPEPLQGEYPTTMPAAVSVGQIGSQVRWGGTIIATNPEAEQTCVEVLGKTLEKSTRPVEAEESQGRFIACKPGFQDPEVFKSGRDVTIIGRLDRLEQRAIGDYEYRYPIIDANVVYLWPERRDYSDRPYYPYYYPYYWGRPYPYFWSPYPYWGRGFHGHVGVRLNNKH